MGQRGRGTGALYSFSLFLEQVPKDIAPLSVHGVFMVKCGPEGEVKHKGEVHEPGKAFWKERILGNKLNYFIFPMGWGML